MQPARRQKSQTLSNGTNGSSFCLPPKLLGSFKIVLPHCVYIWHGSERKSDCIAGRVQFICSCRTVGWPGLQRLARVLALRPAEIHSFNVGVLVGSSLQCGALAFHD